jgi:hypothetical protein
MTTTGDAAATPSTPSTPPPEGPSRTRIITARVLVVLGVLLVVVSLLANFVKREALDRETFRDTSQELIANEAIRNQVAATMVDQLYANVDVAGALEQRLPDNLQSLAAPLAGLGREAINRGAQQLLARPRVQSLFVDASSLAQEQVTRVLQGEAPRLQTNNGNVVLDLRPLVVQLGDRFGFLGDLDQRLPPDAAQITLLKSDDLDTAQTVTQGLKVVANWVWIPAIVAWAIALWLVPGRRRREVRAIGIGLIIAGVALLVIRSLAGSYLVDNLAQSDSVRPAVDAFWRILSDGLAEGAWVVVVIGVIAALGAWLTGPGARARRIRHTVGPWLARPGLAWAVFSVVLLLVVWALPLQRFLTAAILVVLAAIGFEATRRQVAQEMAAEGPMPSVSIAKPSIPWRQAPAGPSGVEELERLARLRADDLLTEEEYAAAKARSLQRVGE